MPKFIAVIKRPYYPSVEEFVTRAEAQAFIDNYVDHNTDTNGQYGCDAYVAEVVSRTAFKAHY